MSKLKYLPGIDDMTERYRTHVQGVAESYRTAGLANASKKQEEVRRAGKTGEKGGKRGGAGSVVKHMNALGWVRQTNYASVLLRLRSIGHVRRRPSNPTSD